MAYVKISDPKIIDLSTIHQIVNVVNQHSDNITALTSNFGSTYYGGSTGTTSGATTAYLYDISSQQVVYGRTTFNPSNATLEPLNTSVTDPITKITTFSNYYIPVTFLGQGFTAIPTVNATIQFDSVQNSVALSNAIVRVSQVTTSSFRINVRSIGSNNWLSGSLQFYVNWTAIGPK